MSMKRIPIEKASNKELHEYATLFLGIEVKAGANNATLIAKILEVQPDAKDVVVADAPAPAVVPVADVARSQPAIDLSAARGPGSSFHNDPRVKILINKEEKPGGDLDVQVGVNGTTFVIQRGVWVEVPYRVIEALQLAIQTIYDPVSDPSTGKIVAVPRDVPSYPVQVDTMTVPSPEAIAAWRQRTDSVFAP